MTLSRPEAAGLLTLAPEMVLLGPVAGAFVGFFNLSVRQGWGVVVAIANGVWTGVLSIAFSGLLYLTVQLSEGIRYGTVAGVQSFLATAAFELDRLLPVLGDVPLVWLTIVATALVGLLSEGLHWLLVRVRVRRRGQRAGDWSR